MAYLLNFEYPEASYHMVNCGNHRQTIFGSVKMNRFDKPGELSCFF